MSEHCLGIGIIGAGRMGRIRALSAKAHSLCRVAAVADPVGDLASSLAKEVGALHSKEWQDLLERKDVHAVVVATPHKYLAEITSKAICAGKHVFCEKPMARTASEAECIASWGDRSGPVKVIGYTLRHHPAVAEGHRVVFSGVIGEPLYIRGRYGHGGRAGYEREWRGSRELSGGGELLDQGVHLIDLSRWFLGEFTQATGFVDSYFWHSPALGVLSGPTLLNKSDSVEDNAFMILRTEQNKSAMLHVSWTQWRNLFSFEVFGTKGFVAMEGLGGSYGQERLLIANRRESGGVPDMREIVFEPEAEDGVRVTGTCCEGGRVSEAIDKQHIKIRTSCWDEEWDQFVRKTSQFVTGNTPSVYRSATANDGLQALRLVDAVYRSARERVSVDVISAGPECAAAVENDRAPQDVKVLGLGE